MRGDQSQANQRLLPLVFPEMKTALRTYHPVPALQRTNGNLQDAPRIKNILKSCFRPGEEQGNCTTPGDVLARLVSRNFSRSSCDLPVDVNVRFSALVRYRRPALSTSYLSSPTIPRYVCHQAVQARHVTYDDSNSILIDHCADPLPTPCGNRLLGFVHPRSHIFEVSSTGVPLALLPLSRNPLSQSILLPRLRGPSGQSTTLRPLHRRPGHGREHRHSGRASTGSRHDRPAPALLGDESQRRVL